MITEKDVVIVVPYYTNDINVFEEISLKQLFRVLGRYPICFLSPESLDVRWEAEGGAPYFVERFPDRCFQSVAAYSDLCEEPSFYERFSPYKYMLLYQTDAFVFSDRLLEFCNMGYDYIGAEELPIHAWAEHGTGVGNGGFCLRRIDAMLRVIAQKDLVFQKLLERFPRSRAEDIMRSEDQFFSFAAEIGELGLRWPSRETARSFAMEHDIDGCLSTLKEALPFGCHYWYKWNFEIWWPIVSGYGYTAPAAQIAERTRRKGDDAAIRWFWYEFFCGKYRALCRAELAARLPGGRARLWGNGAVGRECADVLRASGVAVEAVFDRSAAGGALPPTEENLRRSDTPVIVSTTKYDREIADELSALGYTENRDFFLWSGLVTRWITPAEGEGGS